MSEFSGRVALVTGAGSGIGRAIATALAGHGAIVALVGRRQVELDQVAADIHKRGGRAWARSVDVTDFPAVRAAVGAIRAELGPIVVLVNNAGTVETATLEKTTDEMWDRTMNLNVRAPFFLIRLLAPEMIGLRRGRIVNIASTAAIEGYAYTAAYTASKHALLGMTRAFSKELVASGVTVNALCPGYARTAIVENAVANIHDKTGRTRDEALQAMLTGVPIGRLIEPEEVAAAVLYLVGTASGATSGQAIAISGGLTEG